MVNQLNKFIEEVKERTKEFEGQPSLSNRLRQMKQINNSKDYISYIKKGHLIVESKVITFGEKEVIENGRK